MRNIDRMAAAMLVVGEISTVDLTAAIY